MLEEEILEFLCKKGFCCTRRNLCGADLINVKTGYGNERIILPVEIYSTSPEEAEERSDNLNSVISEIIISSGTYPVILTKDRWNSQKDMMEARLLAHLEVFLPVYARNCEVRKIDKATAADFLEASHSYGDAACRYRYGLYFGRHTGHLAERFLDSARNDRKEIRDDIDASCNDGKKVEKGQLIAVAEFSNARKWQKGDRIIRSYEWTRYASLPNLRISGGMGKMLRQFIEDVMPDDIMSYADLEWSEGKVYEQLGFTLEGHKDAVTFSIDPKTWERKALKGEIREGFLYFRNCGSNKYRMKLTDYQ